MVRPWIFSLGGGAEDPCRLVARVSATSLVEGDGSERLRHPPPSKEKWAQQSGTSSLFVHTLLLATHGLAALASEYSK